MEAQALTVGCPPLRRTSFVSGGWKTEEGDQETDPDNPRVENLDIDAIRALRLLFLFSLP